MIGSGASLRSRQEDKISVLLADDMPPVVQVFNVVPEFSSCCMRVCVDASRNYTTTLCSKVLKIVGK